MIEEFVPYQQSLDIKELGFDEPCLGYWNIDPYLPKPTLKVKPFDHEWCVPAPLYQQAFRWFREKYDLFGTIHKGYYWNISGGVHDIGYNTQYDWDSENYSTYEDAQLECLKQLIKLTKTK